MYRFFTCFNSVKGPACLNKGSDTMVVVFLVVEGMLFGLFTSCMMLDQWTVVTTNVTQIDRLKGGAGADAGPEIEVNETFGGESGAELDWFFPVKFDFPDSIKDEVLGYCVPCDDDKKFVQMVTLV